MEKKNRDDSRKIFLLIVAIGFLAILVVVDALKLADMISLKKQAEKTAKKESVATEETVKEESATTEKAEEVEAATEGTEIAEAEVPEKPEPKISDYFVKASVVEDNKSQYRFSDGSDRIDTLINDYNYFDMYHFASEYIGDTKLGFIRLVGDDSLHLTAKQSPVGTPTTVVKNDIQSILRIIKDPDNKVETFQDDYDDYIDIRTVMDNEANLGTFIYVCHNDTCYMKKYIGHTVPSDIIFNVDYANDGSNSDQTSSFLFIMEKDALKSFLKMAEAGVLFTGENPFEAIGDEWEEVEDYSLFTAEPADNSEEFIDHSGDAKG